MVRGDVFRLTVPRGARGHEQRGARFGVVVQSDRFLALSTVLIAPTSRSAMRALVHPTIDLDGAPTQVMLEQIRVVDVQRLGHFAGRLDAYELSILDEGLELIFGLR